MPGSGAVPQQRFTDWHFEKYFAIGGDWVIKIISSWKKEYKQKPCTKKVRGFIFFSPLRKIQVFKYCGENRAAETEILGALAFFSIFR